MTPENIAALQTLIQANPALAEQLQAATTIENATQLLTQAAIEKNIAIGAAAIADYLASAKESTLTDNELESMAAGGREITAGHLVLSHLTFGFGCIVKAAVTNEWPWNE